MPSTRTPGSIIGAVKRLAACTLAAALAARRIFCVFGVFGGVFFGVFGGVFFGVLGGVFFGVLGGCSSTTRSTYSQKLVILGFDGMDPDLAERWMKEGKLPTFTKLAAEGGLHRLETSHSPESPTAWASFATGVNAGKHNIYDFLVRDTATYLPDLAMVQREPPRFLFNYIPIRAPKITSTRGGTSFWVTAGQAGVRSSILTVPVTFPPEDVPNGELLSGLPLPDIRGTMGTFYYFATDLSRYEEGNTEFGGILKRLVFQGNIAHAEIVGPPNPIARQQGKDEDIRLPFTIRWNHDARSATIDIQGETIHLNEGAWSRWIDLDFNVNLLVRVHGMAQFHLIKAGQDLQLYVSPVNWHPANPPADMSSPRSFAADLYGRLGPYRTLGWPEATWPLNEDRIDEATFMDDLDRAFNDRASTILNRIDAKNWDLLVGVIETTDRVQHMMWRLIDPQHPMYDAELARRHGTAIEKMYRRADTFVGEVLQHLDPGTMVMIVSDHGFHPFRWSVNLNTWLVERGYMHLQGQTPGEKKLDDLFGGGTFWENVDWSNTRAYAMGLGQIYVNLKGREGKGIVNEGAEYERLLDALIIDLMNFLDPRTQHRVVASVYKRSEIYNGPYFNEAADLQVGLESGYRTSWQTALGGAPPRVIEPNMKKWSGDHGSFDYKETAGVLITNRRLTSAATRIIDIAPTVLKYFGLSVPSDIDGKPLF
jgi:predicted AlkP superfamily phosphohydrolase/phosphomutase